MILGIVGSDPRGFQRLVDWLDAVAAQVPDGITVQIGNTPRAPEHAAWLRFEEAQAFARRAAAARLIVCHAGVGALLTAASAGVPAIAVPRVRGEAIDDHQDELARALAGRPGLRVARSLKELRAALRETIEPPVPGGRELVEDLRRSVRELVG